MPETAVRYEPYTPSNERSSAAEYSFDIACQKVIGGDIWK